MPTYVSPGVSDEGSDFGGRAIEGVDTAVAAFVGFASSGPFDTPTRIADWSQYASTFGDPLPGAHLGQSVHGYLLNGGDACYVVRVDEARLDGGASSSPARAGADAFIGDVRDRSGLGALEAIDAVTILCVPDLMSAHQQGMVDVDGVKAVQLAMIAHCETIGDRVAILDPPPNLDARQIVDWRTDQGYDSAYAALYWPWLEVIDPSTAETVHVPPSGYVAGVWVRSDDQRGVHRAPADEVVRGAADRQLQITGQEQDLLEPHGINCLRGFPGRGICLGGARSLSSDPSWRNLNVRRLRNYLEESILRGTQWVVFEPNEPHLWAEVRRRIEDFLLLEWRKGSLVGQHSHQAFFVRCDEATNPAGSIDAGHLVCQVGVAVERPAEFVTFRLVQSVGA